MNLYYSESDEKDEIPIVNENQSSFQFMQEVPRVGRLFKVAVVGASGLVGGKVLEILKERHFPVGELFLFASSGSEGKWIHTPYDVQPLLTLKPRLLPEVHFAFMAAGAAVSKRWGWSFAHKGAYVIDKTSYFRMKSYAPLVVPEVNSADLNRASRIISCPNCTTIPMVNVLAPLHKLFGLKSLTAVSFQAVSGAGKVALETLEAESADNDLAPSCFPARIADNVIPWIGAGKNGHSDEELKIVNETRKILKLSRLPIRATCVRIPVTVGHSIAVHADFRKRVSIDRALKALRKFPGVRVVEDGLYPTPEMVRDTDDAFVGRIRRDRGRTGLAFWIAADNLRKGAASNAVKIAETLINEEFV